MHLESHMFGNQSSTLARASQPLLCVAMETYVNRPGILTQCLKQFDIIVEDVCDFCRLPVMSRGCYFRFCGDLLTCVTQYLDDYNVHSADDGSAVLARQRCRQLENLIPFHKQYNY